MEMRKKGRKVAKHSVFPMFGGSGRSKSEFAKAAGAEPAGQIRDEKCTPFSHEAHLQSKKGQNTHDVRAAFGS